MQNVSGYSEAQKEFVITVGFVITSAAYLPNGTTGQPYKYTFTADGVSTGSVLWIASGDTFPTGLTLSTGGVLSGITNEAGTLPPVVGSSVPMTSWCMLSSAMMFQRTRS